MAPKNEILKFKSGRHLRVSVSLVGKMLIKDYLLDLKEAIADNPVHPPDLEVDGVTIQDKLYSEFRWYYQAIADNLTPPINADDLDPFCRHRFFICGDPVPHWEDSEVKIPDLSAIDKLIGHSYPEPGRSPSKTISGFEPPSGDYDSYLFAALIVNFPENGMALAELYDSEFLNKILKDAAHLSDPDKNSSSSQAIAGLPIEFKATNQMDEEFEGKKDEVVERLKAICVNVPEDF
jgi:hypothetical protein